MIEKLLCERSKTLLEAMRVINQSGKGAAFIVDNDRKLCGILTDGDIRRLLLSNHSLDEPIQGHLNPEPVFARKEERYEDVIKKLTPKIFIIPIVDKDMKVVDYIDFRKNVHVPIVSPNMSGNELSYLVDAFLSTWISSSGHYIGKFETDFSRYCGCSHGVATSSGTTALHLALLACGIKEGDEVIVPDLTFAATINCVLYAKATPVLVDVERDSWCIDPVEIEKAITPRTRAIIPVHLYGQPCDMEKIMAIAKRHNLIVIEDCAQAHGSEFGGKRVGGFGDVGCFSFFGNKVITTGEGGMCVTNSKELYEKMQVFRDHGMSRSKKYWHEVIGFNYRMTNLQAAIGVAQLERIDAILRDRERVERMYRKGLGELEFIELQRDDLKNRKKITWLVSVLLNNDKRDIYVSRLKEKAIDARSFFYPLSHMEIYKKYTYSNKVSTEIASKGINLPTGVDLDESRIEEICRCFTSSTIGVSS